VSTPTDATKTLHPLLARQLQRLGIGLQGDASIDPARLAALLERVSRAYTDSDSDRYLMDRSQSISSREMDALNAALQISQRRLTSLLALSSDWIWEQDANHRFRYVSQSPVSPDRFNPRSLIGRSLIDDRSLEIVGPTKERFRRTLADRGEFRNIIFGETTPDGQTFFIRLSGEVARDEHGTFIGYRGVGGDITDAYKAEMKIEKLARYDSLTSLPNRGTLMDRLQGGLTRAQRQQSKLALFFIDLDRFKQVNDSLGHAAGDRLIQSVTTRLKSCLRGQDTIARVGGDEFVALIESYPDKQALGQTASRILASLSELHDLGDNRVQISGSIGISVYPEDGQSADALLKSADAAMYLAKQEGKNNYQFFTAQLAKRTERALVIEAQLRLALERNEFVLHYQTKFSASAQRACGMEALVRWQHPQRGLLAPGEFIDIAEGCGLITQIGQWVMQEACRQLRAWGQQGLKLLPVSINVSAGQFTNTAFVDDIAHAIALYEISPALLDIEITESMLMEEPAQAEVHLKRLRDLGVTISIDDFGTGYSSLQYLKKFPANTLKIDQSFIRGLPTDRGDAAIVKSVVALSHSLGIRVVAEGVETPEQLAFVVEHGCDEVQGYLLGRPEPAHLIEVQLRPARALNLVA
jgi:diguanylate cyclase (GGDEF)-like protein/PAS domain S-box-containing protein